MPIVQQSNHQDQRQHSNRMSFVDADSFCREFLQQIVKKTFEGVGFENAKRMAPLNTSKQTVDTLSSFTKIAFTPKFNNHQRLIDERDFKPPAIDNLAVQQIHSKTTLPKQNHLLPIKESSSTTRSRIKTKLQKKQEIHKSIHSRRFTQISEQIPESKSKIFGNFQKLPEEKNQLLKNDDLDHEKAKINFFKIQQQNLDRQNQLQILREKDRLQRQKNEKASKDLKKITYDYEGKIFGQGNGITQKQKLLVVKNNIGTLKKENKSFNKKIESTTIEINKKKDHRNDKKDFKQPPIFMQKPGSIIEKIELSKGISAGVRIIEEFGDKNSLTKQNPLKKSANHSLLQFKHALKQSRFKQYNPTSLNKSTVNVLTSNNEEFSDRTSKLQEIQQKTRRNSTKNEVKSKSVYSLGQKSKLTGIQLLEHYQSSRFDANSIIGQVDEMIKQKKQKMKYKGLPFIKTKGYKAIDIDSEMSFRFILDENSQTSKQKKRSRILINDLKLLKTTLED